MGPTATATANLGVAWKTTGGGENQGSTGMPNRWYDANASNRSAMGANSSKTFSHFRHLKPNPNASDQHAGGKWYLAPWPNASGPISKASDSGGEIKTKTAKLNNKLGNLDSK